MRRPRRNHTAAFKAKVAVAALRGDTALIQLAQQFDVRANQITQWKTQWLERAKNFGVFVPVLYRWVPVSARGLAYGFSVF